MSVTFRTHLHGVKLNSILSILSILSAGQTDETFVVKFNFAGFKKLIFTVRNIQQKQISKPKSNELSELSELIGSKREFYFDYTTIYPHNLSSKLVTIKCYRKQFFGNVLVATGSFDLLMLATGPSHHRLQLQLQQSKKPTTKLSTSAPVPTTTITKTPVVPSFILAPSSSPLPLSSHPRTGESKTSSTGSSISTAIITDSYPTIEFICDFDQLCPQFTCALYPPSFSSRIELAESTALNLPSLSGVPELSGVPFAKQKDGSWKFVTSSSSSKSSIFATSQLEKFTIAWRNDSSGNDSKTASTPFSPFSLLKNYDPKRMDLLVPLPQLISTINIARSADSKWRMKITEGPLYHQMSPRSLASEQGVLFGHVMPHYPLPPTWSPGALLGFLASPFHDASTQWAEVEQLIHAHYHKLFVAALSSQLSTSSSSSRPIVQVPQVRGIDEIKKQLEISLVNAKVRWQIDFSDWETFKNSIDLLPAVNIK